MTELEALLDTLFIYDMKTTSYFISRKQYHDVLVPRLKAMTTHPPEGEVYCSICTPAFKDGICRCD